MKKRGLILLVLAVMFITLTGCGDKEKEGTSYSSGSNTSTGTNTNNGVLPDTSKKNTTVDLGKNITSSAALTARGKLVVFVTNSNSVPVDMEIEVEFYDANGVIVGSDTESLNAVGIDSEIAVELYSTPSSFDNYKIYVDVEETRYLSYIGNLGITHNNTGKKIAVQVKNNSNFEIDYISIGVVFYKGGKVVGYDYGLESDIKPDRSANFNISFPYDSKYKNVKFDSYKVFVNEAYAYGW